MQQELWRGGQRASASSLCASLGVCVDEQADGFLHIHVKHLTKGDFDWSKTTPEVPALGGERLPVMCSET